MFTIRVDRTSDGGDHEGYEARRYRAQHGPPTLLILSCDAPDGSCVVEETITLTSGARAYVMNAAGETIATIRARSAA